MCSFGIKGGVYFLGMGVRSFVEFLESDSCYFFSRVYYFFVGWRRRGELFFLKVRNRRR